MLWQREGWSADRMTFDHWNRLVGVARGELPAADFPGGVTARRYPGGIFGEERLLALLGGLANRSASDVVLAVDEAVVDFALELPDDDVAILVARVTCVAVDTPEPARLIESPDEAQAFPSA